MPRRNHRVMCLCAAALAAATCLIAVGCGGSAPAPAGGGPEQLRGTIKVSGAWALYPMVVRWGDEFQKLHPDVRIDVSAGGAGKGIADVLSGVVDLGMVSREIRPEETRQGAVHVAVVKDAVMPTIHAANPVAAELARRGLARETLTRLWLRGEALAWGDVAGRPGVKDFIRVYTRSDACGAAETWAAYLGGAQEDLHGVAVYGDPGLAEAVRKDVEAIGFNNLNFAFDFVTGRPVAGLRVPPLDANGNGRADPEEALDTKAQAIAAIRSGAYPSPPARDLYLVARGGFTGLTRQFVRWVLTDGTAFIDEVGYIAPPEAQLQAGLRAVEGTSP